MFEPVPPPAIADNLRWSYQQLKYSDHLHPRRGRDRTRQLPDIRRPSRQAQVRRVPPRRLLGKGRGPLAVAVPPVERPGIKRTARSPEDARLTPSRHPPGCLRASACRGVARGRFAAALAIPAAALLGSHARARLRRIYCGLRASCPPSAAIQAALVSAASCRGGGVLPPAASCRLRPSRPHCGRPPPASCGPGFVPGLLGGRPARFAAV